ncbi:hypothetical protein [Agromyces sp. PvR057]|uniref:hypothetical protein n=1 Tax=Agromyces sp. PvR057 TaxID=3156403 RepID=UPI003398BD45
MERVRRGVYAAPLSGDPEFAKASESEQRALEYRRFVLAAAQTLRAPIFTSYSAIAVHGLPIVGSWPMLITVLAADHQGYRRRGVDSIARTSGYRPAIEVIEGAAVTSVEHSLIQLCRAAPLGAALTAVDAALRTTRSRTHPPRTTLERLNAERQRMGRFIGSRRVAAVLGRASTGADTPLETCSRLVIEEWGFPAPTLQHRLWLPELGRSAHLDFSWEAYAVGAEADGNGKYLGNGGAEASALAVIGEKDRENAVRRQLKGFREMCATAGIRRAPISGSS